MNISKINKKQKNKINTQLIQLLFSKVKCKYFIFKKKKMKNILLSLLIIHINLQKYVTTRHVEKMNNYCTISLWGLKCKFNNMSQRYFNHIFFRPFHYNIMIYLPSMYWLNWVNRWRIIIAYAVISQLQYRSK